MKRIVSIVLFLCLIIPFTACENETDENAVVWTFVQECVSKNLKSPSTAKFPTYNHATIKQVGDSSEDIKQKWHVESYVDAENSFGAKVRQNFSIDIIRHNDETVTYENLQFD